MTFFFKWVLPIIWLFGVLLLSFAPGVLSESGMEPSIIPLLIGAVLIIIFVYWFLVLKLADEVLDAGNALVVRKGGQEERIALSDIKDIKYSPYYNPPRVRLSLRRHTVFGDRVAFCAPVSGVPFWESPIIHDLIARVRRGAVSDKI
jgi:hypothetical protein